MPLPKRRLAVVYGILVLLVGGTFLEVLTDERHWPFSKYPMYARIAQPTFRRPLVYGVEPSGREFPLLDREQLYPLSAAQVRQTMRRLRKLPTAEQEVRRALLDMRRRYELGRSQGRHDGPPIVAVRMYDCFWDMRGDLEPGPPDRRELRFEVATAERGT